MSLPPSDSILRTRNPEQVQIGVCTDTHLWIDGENRVGGEGNLQLLAESKKLLNLLADDLKADNLDAVIHLGDFTCGGGYFQIEPADFHAAADLTRAVFDRLATTAFGLPGNHDCLPGGTSWRYVERQWGLGPGLGRTVDTPHARLVLLNAQGHSPAQVKACLPEDPIYGWIHDEELARLDNALATAGNQPVILFTHQLLRPWQERRRWKEFYGIRNADAVLGIMANYDNVRMVFQGHAHMLNIHDVVIGTTSCRFVVTPAVIEYPVGWLHLTLSRTQLRTRLRLLPVPALRAQSCHSGSGQSWRAGRTVWQDFCIDL